MESTNEMSLMESDFAVLQNNATGPSDVRRETVFVTVLNASASMIYSFVLPVNSDIAVSAP